MRLLVVEDDRELSSALAKGLREEGFAVDVVSEGEEGLLEAASGDHDLVILDVMLPGIDGFSLVARMRREGRTVPVVFLSAKGETESRIRGLQLGGDDYIVKPFSFEELLARVRAVLRRRAGSAENRVRCGGLELNIAARSVSWEGQELRLTPREYAILEVLLLSSGRVLSRTEIIEHVYDGSFDFDSNLVDVHIANLRRKIARVAGRPVIETVRGHGFRLPGAGE